MLSADVQQRLLAAHDSEGTYRPNHAIRNQLRDKTLVMIVGPAAIGKSFIMNRITDHGSDLCRAPVFTTRDARPDDDPGMFRTMPHNDATISAILDLIDTGHVVEYIVHPTSERIYGTTLSDFPCTFNLLPTLSNTVDHLRQLPFKQTYVIGLSTDPEAWKTWLIARYPRPSKERTRRLDEAISSLTWLLAPEHQSYIYWVENTPNQPDITARAITAIIHEGHPGNIGAINHARRMLDYTKGLVRRREE